MEQPEVLEDGNKAPVEILMGTGFAPTMEEQEEMDVARVAFPDLFWI